MPRKLRNLKGRMPDEPATGGLKDLLRHVTSELGFDQCGVAQVEPLTNEQHRLKRWLSRGFGQGMAYLSRNPEARFDPTSLLPGCKSVIVLAHSVFTIDAGSGLA